jgi:hypothetical protein
MQSAWGTGKNLNRIAALRAEGQMRFEAGLWSPDEVLCKANSLVE